MFAVFYWVILVVQLPKEILEREDLFYLTTSAVVRRQFLTQCSRDYRCHQNAVRKKLFEILPRPGNSSPAMSMLRLDHQLAPSDRRALMSRLAGSCACDHQHSPGVGAF